MPNSLDTWQVDSVTVCNLNYKCGGTEGSGGQSVGQGRKSYGNEKVSWKRVPITIAPPTSWKISLSFLELFHLMRTALTESRENYENGKRIDFTCSDVCKLDR